MELSMAQCASPCYAHGGGRCYIYALSAPFTMKTHYF